MTDDKGEVIVRPDLEQVLSDTKTREIIEEYEQEARTREFTGALGLFVKILALATSVFALYYAIAGAPIPGTSFVPIPDIHVFGETITTPQIYVMLFLGAVLVLTFLVYPPLARYRDRVTLFDVVLALAAVVVCGYVIVNFDSVIYRVNTPTPLDFVLGVIALLLVMEAARRTIGWHLPVLGVVSIAYAYYADFMPGVFRGPPKDLDAIVGNQYFGLDGMLGTPLQVAATFIIMFTIYGAVLDRTGAGKFYVDLAFALAGRRPTGAARTVTFASFLLGTVSGSGVATTVTLGAITYPMLKKAGHDRESAGAILSAGGIGAVISPPVLGAAAFLGASEILLDAPGFWELTRRYWYQYSSLFAIVVFLAIGFSTGLAVFWSIFLAIAVSYVRRETALTPRKILDALANGTTQVLSVAATTAVAGIAVGILLQTGLGLKISSLIMSLSGGSTIMALFLAMVASFVIGLSLPITATYIMTVVMVAPAMVKVGMPVHVAHLLSFYFAVLSEVSPPVGLSPSAAAAVTGGNPFASMMQAWK
jgi:TRAP-type uncharacterized transport system fused permease subunit